MPSGYIVPISSLEQVLQAIQTLASKETEITLPQLQISHISLFPYSPPDNRLLEISASSKRFSHKHVAHDDLKAVGHE